jgi:CRP/FNR family transcriptional regulator, transcriptional activator FtrB
MEDGNFDELVRGAYIQNFPSQIELIAEGEPSDFLHVVVEGTVELFASWNGRDTSLAMVRPIGTFILAATIRDATYLMSARTLQKSRIVLIPSEDVRSIFEKDAGFARAVVTELAQCYRAVIRNTKNLKLRTSIERLANYLVRKQKEAGGAMSFLLEIEKRRLASYLGMTPENLSRAIKSLQAYGVTVDGSQVTITDLQVVLGLAKPTLLIDDPRG